MKNSGIEWIGIIPEYWSVSKLFYNLESPITDGPHETPNYINEGIPFISVDSLGEKEDVDLSIVNKFISEEDYNLYQEKTHLKKGDILFSKSATIGKTAIVGDEKYMIWSPLAVLKNNKEKIYNKYLYYLLNSPSLITHIRFLGSFSSQANVGMREIERAKIPVPPLSEQEKIADYLDKKCSKIDEQKENYEKSIELLKEYKQSFIDKSFQSIGNSEEVRIKNICYVKGRIGWQGLKADEFIDEGPYLVTGTDFQDGGINWDTCYHISMDRYNEAKEIQLKEKDLLVTKDGTVGKLAYIEELPGLTSLNSHLFVVRPLDYNKYDNKYLYRYLQTSDFKKYFHRESSGSIMESLTQETFLNYKLKLPNLNDQLNIVSNIEKSCKQIDKVISYREQMIEKLDEYKKSLIYECVTGKKEIK